MTINFDRFFCGEMIEPIIAHLRSCEHCRRGTRELLTGFPLITMLLPSDKKKAILAALDQLDKETKQ